MSRIMLARRRPAGAHGLAFLLAAAVLPPATSLSTASSFLTRPNRSPIVHHLSNLAEPLPALPASPSTAAARRTPFRPSTPASSVQTAAPAPSPRAAPAVAARASPVHIASCALVHTPSYLAATVVPGPPAVLDLPFLPPTPGPFAQAPAPMPPPAVAVAGAAHALQGHTIALPRIALDAQGQQQQQQEEEEQQQQEVVREAEGLRLHLSPNTASGYKGVYRLQGRPQPYQARFFAGGIFHSLGTFATAVEAAVHVEAAAAVYALHVAAYGLPPGSTIPGGPGTPAPPPDAATSGPPGRPPPPTTAAQTAFQRSSRTPRKKCEQCLALNPTARLECVSCGARFDIKQKNKDGKKRAAYDALLPLSAQRPHADGGGASSSSAGGASSSSAGDSTA